MNVARRQGAIRRVHRRRGTTITLKDPMKTGNTTTLAVSGTPKTETGVCAPPTPVRASLVDGQNIVAEDLETLLDASEWGTVTPAVGLIAVVGGESYRVVESMPLREGDTIYGYRVILRGSN